MPSEGKKRQRTCVTCGKTDAKGALSRIVRPKEGPVAFDPTGRAAGRGAYVCSRGCFEKAVRSRKLERALRCKLTNEDYERVAGEMDGFISEASGK